jgi:Right handed beta helix region
MFEAEFMGQDFRFRLTCSLCGAGLSEKGGNVRRCVIYVFRAALALALGASAEATTRYVSPSGSGTACTSDSPYSLTTGLSQTAAGDTLILQGDDYDQDIGDQCPHIPGGSAESPTTLQAAAGETVWLRGRLGIDHDYVVVDGINIDKQYTWTTCGIPDAAGDALGIGASHVRLKNLEVTGAPDQGITAADGLDDLQFLNLDIDHNGIKPDGTITCPPWVEGDPPGCTPGTPGCTPPGVLRGYCHGTYVNNCTNVRFRGGQIHDNEGMGVHNGNPGQVIDGVEFYNHGPADILLRDGRPDNLLSSNTFHGAGDRAIWGTGNRQRIDHNTFIYDGGGCPHTDRRCLDTPNIRAIPGYGA